MVKNFRDEQQDEVEIARRKVYSFVRYVGLGLFLVAIVIPMIFGSFYTVNQTDLAYVTQFGKVINAKDGPITPGLHFKLPFIQSVDSLRVTLDTDDLGVVPALTKDTQSVDFKVSITTRIPPDAVYHLMYEVGKSGNVDLTKNYNATILTELRNVISRHQITEIAGEGREAVLKEFQIFTQDELKRLYGIIVGQVQVSIEKMPGSYVERINQAMLSQAAILQSERDKTKAGIDAETARIKAAGEANRVIEEARGRSQSNVLEATAQAQAIKFKGQADADVVLLQAQAQSQSIKLKGQADADVVALKGAAEAQAKTLLAAAVAASPGLVEYMKAVGWDGKLPQNIYASAPIPIVNIK